MINIYELIPHQQHCFPLSYVGFPKGFSPTYYVFTFHMPYSSLYGEQGSDLVDFVHSCA